MRPSSGREEDLYQHVHAHVLEALPFYAERALVTGSRDWPHVLHVQLALRSVQLLGVSQLAHGACHLGGADLIADQQGRLLGLQVHPYPVKDGEWQRFGKSAGNRRNVTMVDHFCPQLVLAFPLPSSRGTWHCVEYASSKGISCLVIYPSWEIRRH